MRVCAAGSCKSNSELNLGLVFHPLPKDDFVKDQWIDLLDIDDSKISDQTRVCSLHFKSKDYGTLKRNLKASALPSLYLSKEKAVPAVDVSDVTGEYGDVEGKKGENNSDSDKQSLDKDTHQVTTETKKEEEKPVRRASRKAALLAAEKIQRAVREYGLLEGVRSETPEPEPKKDSTVKLNLSKALKVELIEKQQSNMTPTMPPSKNMIRPITVGYSHTEQNALYMECFEEVLSPVQVAAYRQAQQEYDKVMKYILSRRASKNEKVKIIYTSHEGEVLRIGQVGDSGNRITTSPSTGVGKIIPTSIVTRPLAIEGPQNAKPSSAQTMSGESSASKLLVEKNTGVIMGSLPKDITILQSTTGQTKTAGFTSRKRMSTTGITDEEKLVETRKRKREWAYKNRLNMTQDKRLEMRSKNKEQQQKYRSSLSAEKLLQIRSRNRELQQKHRSSLSEEQQQKIRSRNRIQQQQRRANISQEQRQQIRVQDRERHRHQRTQMRQLQLTVYSFAD